MASADQAERLFELALERRPAERKAFLETACAGTPKLCRELAALLPHAESDPGFLAIPVLQITATDPTELLGDRAGEGTVLPEEVGGYLIVRVLGYGATAVVYEARQQNPERLVALKLLSPGPATPGLRRRFNAEVQLLSRLHHPGIAQIIEAGVQEVTDPRGMVYRLPFLVTELVRGQRLDHYVTRTDLSVDDRLRLFTGICDAVDHAHCQGIVHRDLKPANILVEDGGRSKILDFGIAMAAAGAEGDTSAPHTATGQLLGSVAYMSPEQLADSHRVDVRADIYALGVILYQLLAGRPPFDVGHLTVAEAAVLIETTEAPPLSSFDRAYRGDLRIIAAKAMAKDRSRRYQTAAELAGDVLRHFEHRPIRARPASLGYRLRKLVRRNPAAAGGAAATVLAFALGGWLGAFLGFKLARRNAESRDLDPFSRWIAAVRSRAGSRGRI